MLDINKHRFFLVQILKDIYSDIQLGNYLGFKGGSALMFFYNLPRFSVDLDFNLLELAEEDNVYQKVRQILLKYGSIFDESKKFYGPILVLDYGIDERKLKIEISNRIYENNYEIKNLLGIDIKVMVQEDMFAHKLCALLDREAIANRDIFDCWYFMQRQTPVNKNIVEFRMEMLLPEYLQACIQRLEGLSKTGLLQGIGELMDDEMKVFVRSQLIPESIRLLKFYQEFPIVK